MLNVFGGSGISCSVPSGILIIAKAILLLGFCEEELSAVEDISDILFYIVAAVIKSATVRF